MQNCSAGPTRTTEQLARSKPPTTSRSRHYTCSINGKHGNSKKRRWRQQRLYSDPFYYSSTEELHDTNQFKPIKFDQKINTLTRKERAPPKATFRLPYPLESQRLTQSFKKCRKPSQPSRRRSPAHSRSLPSLITEVGSQSAKARNSGKNRGLGKTFSLRESWFW